MQEGEAGRALKYCPLALPFPHHLPGFPVRLILQFAFPPYNLLANPPQYYYIPVHKFQPAEMAWRPMTNDLFSLLRNTVRVLIVDDEPAVLRTSRDNFVFFPIYRVSTADSTSEALSILEEGGARVHVCIMDRGMCDVQGNEFHLLDTYRNKMPFVVITGRENTEKGFECGTHGAKRVISKGTPDFHDKMLRTANDLALMSIVFPGSHQQPSPFLCRCMEALLEKRPLYVNELARSLNMTDKTLRNGWTKYLGIDPKYSLCIFHLYAMAFDMVGKLCKNGTAGGPVKKGKEPQTADFYTSEARFCRYYKKNKPLIDDFISSYHNSPLNPLSYAPSGIPEEGKERGNRASRN